MTIQLILVSCLLLIRPVKVPSWLIVVVQL
jgi:hypothetical protein